MTTTARPNRQTLGHSLAAKAQKPRRTVRRKRPTPRRTAAERAAQAECDLAKSSVDREAQRLADKFSAATVDETITYRALDTSHEVAESARAHRLRVYTQGLHQQFDSAHFVLKTAEARERKAFRLHAAAIRARELIGAELQLLVEAAR